MRDDSLYLDLLNKIANQVDETQQCVTKLDKKLDLNIQEVKHEIALINVLDVRQNELLDDHIKRTAISEKRLDYLEENNRFKHRLKNLVLAIGGVLGALYTILKVIETIS